MTDRAQELDNIERPWTQEEAAEAAELRRTGQMGR